MRAWLRDVWIAVTTVLKGLWVTIRCGAATFRRGAYTQIYEYPEKPAVIDPRWRGFHRYDLPSCIACGMCTKACPAECISLDRVKAVKPATGFVVRSYIIDYGKCLFCGQCVPVCPAHCLAMGSQYDLSGYSREGCIVDFTRIPLEIAWSPAGLNRHVVAASKAVTAPVWDKQAEAAKAAAASEGRTAGPTDVT